MIIKYFEINKVNLKHNNLILFYGKNEGLKNETIEKITKNKVKLVNYDERDIVNSPNEFIETVLNKSLFDDEKLIIIRRATDRIIKILEQFTNKKIGDTVIICSDNLEKKSKLRMMFEKEKKYICVAFYPDSEQTLIKFAYNFFKKKKISLSSSDINILINRCNEDRATLMNELEKIELFAKGGKKVTTEIILKLSNIMENENISKLVDYCLAKNKKKIIDILNENSFSNDDTILIIRTFLNKLKKILKLSEEFEKNCNIDLTIASARPPIFWKDKEITKSQITKWRPDHIKKSIYKLSEIELQIKKNYNNQINLITDFILDQTTINTNN